jgi:fructose-1,6-bisphosphatase/inositol monophosphatase family enzyme/RimJ/RimL family protein N-acetyltransferase
MIQDVTDVVRRAVDSVVMPSFRMLRPEDISAKNTVGDPDDIVTITDGAAERYLISHLTGIVPGAVFIGEEGVCENPALLDALSEQAPAWLIDPIDGTKNFARGNTDFGVMLALVTGGLTQASWIALPATGDIITAGRGAGTTLNGNPVVTRRHVPARLRGTVHTRLMPAAAALRVAQALDQQHDPRPSTGSAATEYAAILRGEKDFVIYYRLLPWDHAPGALALEEAGGSAVHLDGRPYTPLSTDQVTIFGATPEIASTVLSMLRAQRVGRSLPNWTPRPHPPRTVMTGRFCRVEPLDPPIHARDLYTTLSPAVDDGRWTYLPYGPFADRASFELWLEGSARSADPLFHAIVTPHDGGCGLASYMRIDHANGVIEVGHLNFSSALQRTAAATEAMYLMMRRAFDELGYRRYEWKCDSLNEPSLRAAVRLGFTYEGLFRQAVVYKGRNRDTAWFSIIDTEWRDRRAAFEAWLAPANFDATGVQRRPLSSFMPRGSAIAKTFSPYDPGSFEGGASD